MGGNKALKLWPCAAPSGPIPLFARAALTLESFCSRVEVATGEGQPPTEIATSAWGTFPDARPAGWPEDSPVNAGPLAGLVAALERAAELNLAGVAVLACDMPLVEPEDFEPLIQSLEKGADAAMWTVPGDGETCQDQPLVAVYGVKTCAAARAALDSGARRLVAIADVCAAHGRHLAVERVIATENYSRRLVNVNTPYDYHGAAAAYRLPTPTNRGEGR